MTVEQFVMAYGAEQDRLRALLPEGFASRKQKGRQERKKKIKKSKRNVKR